MTAIVYLLEIETNAVGVRRAPLAVFETEEDAWDEADKVKAQAGPLLDTLGGVYRVSPLYLRQASVKAAISVK